MSVEFTSALILWACGHFEKIVYSDCTKENINYKINIDLDQQFFLPILLNWLYEMTV